MTWVHVATVGEWDDHPSGSFRLDETNFDEMIANHTAPVPVDREFASVYETADLVPLGWVISLEKRYPSPRGHVQLWAWIKMASPPPEAKALYGGGVLEFDAVDRQTGDRVGLVLGSLSLTERPYFADLAPIEWWPDV